MLQALRALREQMVLTVLQVQQVLLEQPVLTGLQALRDLLVPPALMVPLVLRVLQDLLDQKVQPASASQVLQEWRAPLAVPVLLGQQVLRVRNLTCCS